LHLPHQNRNSVMPRTFPRGAASENPMRIATLIAPIALSLMAGCVGAGGMGGTGSKTATLPVMRWDHRPEADQWTAATLNAVARYDSVLADDVPADIGTWCPGYAKASIEERRTFWAGLLSALAKHESTWNPKASGGGGKWIGLTQIAPGTARGHGCEATNVAELKNGAANLECAVQIAADKVAQDGLVAGNGNRGLGRDWAPFRADSKMADMAAWTRAQSYCQG
jgi:Transglycosylase SLT domain